MGLLGPALMGGFGRSGQGLQLLLCTWWWVVRLALLHGPGWGLTRWTRRVLIFSRPSFLPSLSGRGLGTLRVSLMALGTRLTSSRRAPQSLPRDQLCLLLQTRRSELPPGERDGGWWLVLAVARPRRQRLPVHRGLRSRGLRSRAVPSGA